MYIFIYNDKQIVFDNNELDNQYNKYNKRDAYEVYIKDKVKDKLKEKFISTVEGELYINKLKELSMNIGANQTMRNQITNLLKNDSNRDKQQTLDSITDIYAKYYIESIDKKNAHSYNQFLKFNKETS